MLQVFYLDVAMTIQVCFKSILHMLQRSDGCCRGDETLGRRRGATEDRGAAGDGVMVRGEERGGLDEGAQPGWVSGTGWVTGGRTRSLAGDLKRAWGHPRCDVGVGVGAASRRGPEASHADTDIDKHK